MTFTPRDAKDVSALVAKKLELYMNVERREDRFDPQGYLRTTPKMKTLDLMYQMLDKAELEGKSKSSPRGRQSHPHTKSADPRGKKSSKDKKDRPNGDEDAIIKDCKDDVGASTGTKGKKKERQRIIRPKLIDNSRRVVPKKEADRITLTVNKIFEEQDLDRLHVIHRYRPHSPDVAALTENGKVLGYTRHVGSALHGDHYVDFYLREGLQTGKADHSKRLQRLKEGREKSESRSIKVAGKDSSSINSQQPRHDWATKSRMRDILSPLNPSSSCESVSSAGASGRRTPSSQRPVYTTFLSSTPMSSRASAGQALESQLGYKVLSRIEDAKGTSGVDGGRGEGDVLAGEKWDVGCRDEPPETRVGDEDNNVMGAGSVSARQESRADLASSEDYCRFSTGKNTSCVSESRQEEDSEISKGQVGIEEEYKDAAKFAQDPIHLRDVQMSYKRYRPSDTGFVLSGLGAAEMTPRGLGGLVSARSTQSEPVKCSRRRSVRSRNRLPPEMSPFPTTVSEDGSSTTRTISSSSIESSTPRRALSHREPIKGAREMDKSESQALEPIRAILETPEVPRLGLTSDLNDTNRSLFSNERIEDYTTTEQQVRQHPDTRASEGHVSSRAGEREFRNKDGRAEEKYFKGTESEIVESKDALVKDAEKLEFKTTLEGSCMPEQNSSSGDQQGERKATQKTESNNDNFTRDYNKTEVDRQSITSQSSRQSCNLSQKNRSDQGTGASADNKSIEKGRGLEIERGEDEGRNTELDRGHETAGSSSGISQREKKKTVERGDDMSETFHEDIRLSQSARTRGQSQYHTTKRSERGLEREYFTPLVNQAEQYIIPPDEDIEDSLVEASALNSRPSSAASSRTSQGSGEGSKRKKKSIRRFSKTSNASAVEKEVIARPTSAASKDGRGDDSLSVASAGQSSFTRRKHIPSDNDKEERPASVASHVSQMSPVVEHSVSSRGSVSGKDKPGLSQGYCVANMESVGRGLDEISGQVVSENLAEGKTLHPVLDQGKEMHASVKETEGDRHENVNVDPEKENMMEVRPTNDLLFSKDNEVCKNHDERRLSSASDKSTGLKESKAEVEETPMREGLQNIQEIPPAEKEERHSPDQVLSEAKLLCEDRDDQGERKNDEDGPKGAIELDRNSFSIDSKKQQGSNKEVAGEEVKNRKLENDSEPEIEERSKEFETKTEIDAKGETTQPSQAESKTQNALEGQSVAEPVVHQSSKDGGDPSEEIPLQEKAFIDSGDATEIVKVPVSACVSLDADTTVIDFRPSSASTAKSFTVDHETGAHQASMKEKQRAKQVQPSRIVEVTESEGSATPGRDTHRAIYNNNEIIQKEYVIPADPERNKPVADAGQVLDLAVIKSESQVCEEVELVHPGVKKRGSKADTNSQMQARDEHHGKEKEHILDDKTDECQANIKTENKKPESILIERRVSSSSLKSNDNKYSNERPPSAASQKSGDKVNLDNRPSAVASQKSGDKVNLDNRPPSATSQKSGDKENLENRPLSVVSHKSGDKVNLDNRPPSAASHKSEEKVNIDNRPPSVASQKSGDKVDLDNRRPSVASHKSGDKVIIDNRPPSVASQKSVDKVNSDNRPPSVASQKSGDKVNLDNRPPSVASQKSEDKMTLDNRPPSAASQKSGDKVNVDNGPPSVASQQSEDKIKLDNRPPSVASQKSEDKMTLDNRPPSAASQKSGDKVNVDNRPPSVASHKSENKVNLDKRPPSVASQKSGNKVNVDNRPPSVASQQSGDKIKLDNRPPSVAIQKSEDKVTLDNRPLSAASQKSGENVNVDNRLPSVASQKSENKVNLDNRPPSVASQKSGDKVNVDNRPSSAASKKSGDKVNLDNRPPSVTSQKSGDKINLENRPPSVASQKSGDKVNLDNRPSSVASQKSGDIVNLDNRPPSVASQKSGDKVNVDNRPPSVASQKSGDQLNLGNRPPSAASQKSGDKVNLDNRIPSEASQNLGDKVNLENRPPSVASQKSGDKVNLDNRPPSVASQKSGDIVNLDNRPSSVASEKCGDKENSDNRPPSVASQKSGDKVNVDNRPPSVASQKSGDKVNVDNRPSSVASQKSGDKVNLDNRPPSVTSQKSGDKINLENRPPSVASQKSGDKVNLDNRPSSVASQKSGDIVNLDNRPSSVASEKCGDKENNDNRPPSVASQKSGDQLNLGNRPPSAASQKSGDKVNLDNRIPSEASQNLGDKVNLDNRPPSVPTQ